MLGNRLERIAEDQPEPRPRLEVVHDVSWRDQRRSPPPRADAEDGDGDSRDDGSRADDASAEGPAEKPERGEHHPIRAAAAGVATDAPTLDSPSGLPGRRDGLTVPGPWARLEIREPIGRGGFGDVYRAWDPTLEREVALKLVTVDPGDPDGAAGSVLAEGRRLARVRHPNVMAVYGAEREGDHVGIWGELIHGRTLASIVAEDGTMGAQEAALVGITLCQALAAVHGAGLLHRDVKAQNVIREQGGRIVLVDLGAGRTLLPESTDEHDLRGTPLYMAPELFEGRHASPSTDRYSLGVLLYYLVSGRFPFPGNTSAEIADSFARGERRSLRDARPDLPEAFVRTVERAISPDPTQRQRSDGELESELSRSIGLDTPREPIEPTDRLATGRRRRLALAAALLAAVALVVVLFVLWPPPQPGREATPPLPPSIALSPIQSLSDDPADEFLAAGLTSVIESNLGSIPGLLVFSAGNPSDAETPDPKLPERRLPDRRAGVSYELRGTLQRAENAVRATLQLSEAEAGALAWSRTFDGRADDPFDLQARLVDDLVRALRNLALIGDPQIVAMRERLDANPTDDPEAFAAYARGLTFAERPNEPGMIEQAIEAFEEAVERDPGFALAHAELASACWEKYERSLDPAWTQRAIEHGRRALELAPEVPRVLLALAVIHHGSGDSQGAIAELEKAITLQPASDAPYLQLGLIYADLGKPEPAERALRKAIELRPAYARNHAALGYFLFGMGRYEDAIEAFRLEATLQPRNGAAQQRLATAYHAAGDLGQAEIHYRRAIELSPTATALSGLGTLYYGEGRYQEAVETYEQAVELSPNLPVTWRNLGDANRSLGDVEASTAAYEKAIELTAQTLRIDASDARSLALQALLEAKVGRSERALEQIEKAESLLPNDAEILYQKAAILSLSGRPDDALATLQQSFDTGYTRELLARDHDFDALRGDPEFEALIAE